MGVRPLVVRWAAGDQSEVDWTTLSRKHAIEVDPAAAVTIFGGKLTDCLNVGEEVADAIEGLGLPLEEDLRNWYGEPSAATRAEFFRQARLMRLDGFRTKADTEPLSDRLWRRYGRRAFAMLDAIREDPAMAEEMMGSADYLRVELHTAAQSEMVTKLEDFMRRRSKIDLVVPRADIESSPGLREVAEILFGADADRRLAEYFGGDDLGAGSRATAVPGHRPRDVRTTSADVGRPPNRSSTTHGTRCWIASSSTGTRCRPTSSSGCGCSWRVSSATPAGRPPTDSPSPKRSRC